MSSGQIPRTPEYFPRMKYRARKRRAVQDLCVAFSVVDWTAITRGFENAVVSINQFAEGLRTSRDWQLARHLPQNRPTWDELAKQCGIEEENLTLTLHRADPGSEGANNVVVSQPYTPGEPIEFELP